MSAQIAPAPAWPERHALVTGGDSGIGRATAIAASSAFSVVAMSRRSSCRGIPTTTLRAESATHPSTDTAKSRLSRSPSRSV